MADPVREKISPERKYSGNRTVMCLTDETIDPAFVITSCVSGFVGEDSTDNAVGSTWHCYARDDPDMAYPQPLVGVRAGVGESNATVRRVLSDEAMRSSRPSRLSSHTGAGGRLTEEDKDSDKEADAGGRPRCCGLDDWVMRWSSRFPLNKIKILVGVWQILTVFSSITGVEFPSSYSVLLS